MARRWTTSEDRELRGLYPEGVPIAEIARQLGRSEEAVSERRRSLGMAPRPRSRPWSEGEDRLLRAAVGAGVPAQALAGTLRRSPEQVRRRRRALVGAASRPRAYSPADDAAIRDAWGRGGDVDVNALALALGRSPGSLRSRAAKLGCHRPAARPRWSAAEDATVRDGYELGLTCAEIVLELPGRTTSAVVARAAKLGLASYARVWTAADDRRLSALAASGAEVEQAARVLSRTPEALRARARKLGLPPLRSTCTRQPVKRWTPDEDSQLRLHVGANPAVLAQMLGRSPEAVVQRLRRLGLREARRRSPHHLVPARHGLTPGELATVVRELRDGGPRRRMSLAHRLGVTPGQLRLEEANFLQ